MRLTIFAGSSNPALAKVIQEQLQASFGTLHVERFPDGEVHLEIGVSVRGSDVYLLQSTNAPSEERLFELMLAADACRRAGAERLTAVIPYFAYARQDRRATTREAVAARLVASLLSNAGFDRVVAIDLHSTALEGFFDVPLEHLSAVDLLAEAVRPLITMPAVVLAPDLGAAKLAGRYGRLLDLPAAIVQKTRLSARQVSASAIFGDVTNRALIIVDDMISTGGTVQAAAQAALERSAFPDIIVATSHALLVDRAIEHLSGLPIRRLVCTDTVEVPECSLPLERVSVGPLLAEVIRRLHTNHSLAELIRHE